MVAKVVRRSIKKDKVVFLSINVMVVMTIILSVLSLLSYELGYKSFQEYKAEVNLEDFQMQTIIPLSDEEISDIESKYQLALDSVNKYVYTNDEDQITLYEYNPENNISKIKVLEGSETLNDNEIILSKGYADNNEIKVGDSIEINDNVLKITGFDFFAEDIYPVKEGGLLPENNNVAIGFVNSETFNAITQNKQFSTIYRGKYLSDDVNKKDVEDGIKSDLNAELVKTNILGIPVSPIEYQEASNVISLIPYSQNFNIGMIELEYKFLSVIMMAMSILIGVITVVLSLFLFRSIVEKQRREIGILRSFGIYKREIMNEYSKIFSIAIIIDAVVGIVLGVISYNALDGLYSQFFNFIDYSVNGYVYLIIVFVVLVEAIILLLLVRYFAIKRNLDVAVLNMVKNVAESKESIKKSKLKFKKFENKLKFNIIIRNRNKTLLLVYGIAFATFLLVFGLSMIIAVKNMQSNIYGTEFSYSYEAVFSNGFTVDPDKYSEESVIYTQGQLQGESDSISLIGYDVDNPYVNINNDEKLVNNEVYVTSYLADAYNLKAEDSITIVNPMNKDEKYDFTVKAIADNKAESKVYTNIDYLQDIFEVEDTYYNGYVGADVTKEQIDQGDDNMVYVSTEDIINGINEYSTIINVAIVYIALFAFLISLISLNVVTSIIIKNNEKTISIMKVLGYKTKEINKFIISGYRPVVVVSFLVMFPISAVGVKYYMKFILSLIDGLNYPLVLKANFTVFIVSFLIVILSFEISLFITKRKINKISLAKSLSLDE